LAIAWFVVGVVLLAFELHHFALYALFAAVGCFDAGLVALVVPDAIFAQVVAAVPAAVAGIVLVRPRVSAALLSRQGGHRGRGVHGGFVGSEVLTLDAVGGPDQVGHVQLAGERWRAVSGADVVLPAGTRVTVTGVEGTTLVVWPADGFLPVEGLFDPGDRHSPEDGEQEQS
jgi:membrane protein implicated in regulation of membrane protease activity